ncbi:Arc/MetJ family transcription regulator [Spinactinospora alkalitolerans]|uniref:Arc/MetJ family transcription regulator n=1 Tax=Spinactinospora alkalitolerans TaxID=687207 RepID=A0A852U0F5_9ACTN|nr:type II toxin-antitoxin system VapB family antitoxin [Spinactinospora alkalitolerans]NYE49581.1 Arc/MetJ family transcription regulator [Spinactinospora alkalitolerans]
MAKTSIDISMDKARIAQEVLGTTTLKATVDAALDAVIREAAREKFITRAKSGAFAELLDPGVEQKIWS